MSLLSISALACSNGSDWEENPEPQVAGSALSSSQSDELEEIEQYLAARAPHEALVQTTNLYGEVVDCIDFYHQPGVKSLLAAGEDVSHTKSAPAVPVLVDSEAPTGASDDSIVVTEKGPVLDTACPEGSVPIRRILAEEILAFGGLDAYLNKAPPAVDQHEYAAVNLYEEAQRQ